MGKSRSATVCIAYLLHQQPGMLTPQSALALIREGRPLCEPNDGFMQQLALYHEMGCPEDVTNHPMYQRWLYHREVEESVACGRAPELRSVRFEDEQLVSPQETSDRSVEIKCRKCRFVFFSIIEEDLPAVKLKANLLCRRTLATTPFIISHEQEKRTNARAHPNTECAHVFLHPLKWMRPSLFPSETDPTDGEYTGDAPLSGRLTCPNSTCGANIGKFAWQGMQCSCNSWVVPAIGLARARVDIANGVNGLRGPGNLPPGSLGIRLPPGMRPAETNDSGSGRGNL